MRLTALSLVILVLSGPAAAGEIEDPALHIRQILTEHARDPDAQVAALADLTWPDGPADPATQALAREQLIGFGKNAFTSLRKKLIDMKPEYRADLVNAAKEAFALLPGGRPPEYLPIMYDAVWFGDRNARLAAIPEIMRFGYKRATNPMIDAAEEDPALAPVVIEALAALQDQRARFWLGDLASRPGETHQQAAAVALARIGKSALVPLRECLVSPDRGTREIAARALSVSAGSAELTYLYDYLKQYPDDDPGTLEAIRARTVLLERALEVLDEELSESGEPEI